MPRPLKGEKKSVYISRAIRYMIREEGLEKKHAIAKAIGMWETKKKKR